MTTHLQGVGSYPAIPARDLIPGQKRVYNYGYSSDIIAVEPMKSGKSVRLTVRAGDGKLYTNIIRAGTLIAIE